MEDGRERALHTPGAGGARGRQSPLLSGTPHPQQTLTSGKGFQI